MKKKIIPALLMCSMLFTMTACSSAPSGGAGLPSGETKTETAAESQQTEAASETAAENDIMTPFGRYEETVTFTSGREIDPKLPAEFTYEDNRVTRYIEEKVNVKVKNAWAVDANTLDQKIALAIASDDLPDVMVVSDRKTLQQLQEADMIADLTEYYDQCMSPFLKEQFDSFNGALLAEATFDGKLMAIPGTNIGGAHNLLWIRQDWLDKLGLEPPKTIDDIIRIGKAFIEQDPGGNGEGKTIGLTGKQEITGIYNSMHGLDTVFSLYGAYPRQWVKDASGNVIYGSVAPEMKEALIKLNEMYEEGVLDKQFALRKDSDSKALISGGKCGMMFGAWWAPYDCLSDSVKNDPSADWKPYLAPLDEEGYLNVYTQDPVQKFLVVRKGYEHPEAIIKALNCEAEIFRGTNPEAAEIMKTVNGNGEGWGEPCKLQIDYNDAVYRFYTDLKAAVESEDPSALRDDYKTAYECVMKDKEAPRADAAAWAEASARMEGQALTYVPEVKFHDNAFYGTTPTMELKWTNLKKLEDESIIKFIMGTTPIDEFDEFVEQWNKLGGEQITNEVRDMCK